ncbi:MAG: penicillin acylase family protein [Bacteroidales bacterium]
MKSLKRILTIAGILLAVVIFAGMLYLNHLKSRAVPDYNQGMDLEHLQGEVTVYRDSLGIPHIYAEDELDLYRTVGYVMAQDRLWQMDLMRRITSGRLSEVLDPGLIDTDQLFRALDFSEKSERVMAQCDPHIMACVEAFAGGVNQYIESHRKKLPVEFALLGYQPELWEPIHTFNLIGYMAWDLSSGWGPEIALYKMRKVLSEPLLAELIPSGKYQPELVHPDFKPGRDLPELMAGWEQTEELMESLGLQIFEGSNNWAVSGEKSESGMPLMANDMHLGLMAPGIWYQMHHVVEGTLNVTGVALPGAPFVICGHNEDIAWGMTNVTVDDIDFYLETIHPSDTNRYLLDGAWKEMELKTEEIRVKGQDEPVIRVNRYTHRGPVISRFRDLEDGVISARWQGREFSNEVRTVYLLNRAGNWQEFRDAVRTFTSISQNIVYADRSGNIGLQTAAGIPIREEPGIMVYPGDTSLYDWKGTVPFEELPYTLNPEEGHVSSANNRTVGEDYPYYIGAWFSLPSRIERVRELLNEKEKLGIDDFRQMQGDQTSPWAREMTHAYLSALTGETEGPYEEARKILQAWDFNLRPTSSAALIFETMWLELNRALFHDELGDELYPLMLQNNSISRLFVNRIRVTGSSLWCDDITTGEKTETFADNILSAFRRTVDTLTSRFGEDMDQWEWGKVHKVAFMHPLGSVGLVEKLFRVNRGPFTVGGSYHTVSPYSYPIGTSFIANHGASERHIFTTADWDRSLTIIPTGTSGIPASPFYMDQTQRYLNYQYHRDLFTREAVESASPFKAVFY